MAIQPVETNPAGELNPENTTTALLGIGSIFTGIFTEVINYGALAIIVFSDQASATDGLEFQWSGDGINADVTEGSSVLANVGRAFSISVRARYFRIKYTNGGVAQTVFRLTTVYHTAGSGLISRPIDKSLTTENFAQTVRSVMTVKQADGSFLNAVGNASGVLQTDGSTVTQPVSATSLPLPTGAATAVGLTTIDTDLTNGNQKSRVLDGAGTAITSTSINGRQAIDTRRADVSLQAVTATGTAGAAVTLTLPAVAAVFHYIQSIEIVKYATAAITGTATPVVVTTTNLPGSPAFTFGTSQAIGTTLTEDLRGIDAFRSSTINTATTIVCPATTSIIWRVNVFYYTTG